MTYKIKLEPEASADIQQAIDWYNEQQKGLGKKFYKSLQKSIDGLTTYPFYQVRYGGNVRCLPVKNFPYMLILRLMKIKQLSSFVPYFIPVKVLNLGQKGSNIEATFRKLSY